jgi:hypothetical protein
MKFCLEGQTASLPANHLCEKPLVWLGDSQLHQNTQRTMPGSSAPSLPGKATHKCPPLPAIGRATAVLFWGPEMVITQKGGKEMSGRSRSPSRALYKGWGSPGQRQDGTKPDLVVQGMVQT